MNKSRRKTLGAITLDVAAAYDTFEAARTAFENAMQQAKTDIGGVRDEEVEALDALPEAMQNGEQGGRMQEAVDTMGGAQEDLDEILNALADIGDKIEEIKSKLGEAQS